MRAGQHGTLTRVWDETGERAEAPKQTEYGSLYMHGATCCEDGRSHSMLSSHLRNEEISTFLESFGKQLRPDEHALLLMDNAPFHTTTKVVVPPNVTLLFLPPYSPQLNPAELPWREMRMKDLANRVFKTVEDVETALIASWNKLTSDTSRIKSLCGFGWILAAASS